MIKLKSLFRRGQGSSSAAATAVGNSTGKKHSNNNRNKSQSTTSLNSALDKESQQLQQQNAQQQQSAAFPQHGAIAERGVDVGDEQLSHVQETALPGHSQTLPQQKKSKGLPKKGQKQPKQLPIEGSNALAAAASKPLQAPAVVASTTATSATTATVFVNSNYSDAEAATKHVGALAHNAHYAMSSATTALVAPQSDSYELQQLLEASGKMQELQAQLERAGSEKRVLELRIAELIPYQHEVGHLRSELHKMQGMQDKSQLELISLRSETESLRTRLRDVVNSPLSDAEKHQIIQDSQRLHSSAPASIALPSTAAMAGDDTLGVGAAATDWDKHSSSSEISVACLQDKIIQMEETHYSTNEELQATLQELTDLQAQLGDAHTENERLAEEKDVLFQSLCRQTEKLNEARTQNSTLQELLLRDAKQAEISTSEREQKLLDLIKTSQAEREALLVKQEELNTEQQELRQALDVVQQENGRFKERIAVLNSTVDAVNAERKQLEAHLTQHREEISQHVIEMSRLSTLLENARSKIDELEQDLTRGDKTDLSDVLDAARKEKDVLEQRVAELQDQCSRLQAEMRRVKEQFSALGEEYKVAKNNAKCAASDMEYRLEQLKQANDKLSVEHQQLSDSTAELHIQCKCHLAEKAQLESLLSETQKHLGDAKRRLDECTEQLDMEMQLRRQDADEWQQFQSDLLMTVRVANDFKTEALSAREQLVIDNKTQKERIRLLEQQLEKLNKQQIQQNETQQSVLTTVHQEMASRRNKIGNLNRQDSRLSVKTLIETIENNKQSPKTDESGAVDSSQCPTNASDNGIGDTAAESTQSISPTDEWSDNVHLQSDSAATGITLNLKGPMREQQKTTQASQQQQQQQQPTTTTTTLVVSNIVTKSTLLMNSERKDPLNMLAKNGGSKRNALLKWCQNKTVGYRNIDITNFSSSWNDGLAFCAMLHSYLPDCIPYDTLTPANKRRNFSLAFAAAESVGIPTTLNINDMCQLERPDWMQVMTYITAIYKHFET